MASIKSYRTLYGKAAKELIPLYCLFELTYRCNLNCVHCYIVKNRKKEINKYEVFNILEQLKKAGCLYLTFSGGEIFIRKDFFEIANYAQKLNFALRLFTNGTLIDEKIANKIRSLNSVSVEITLYGFEKTHEEVTQAKGSFSKAIKAIRLLKKREIKVFAKTVLMKQNADEIWKLKDYAKRTLKIGWMGTGGSFLLSPCNDGNRKPLNYRPSDEQLKDYIKEELQQLGKSYKPRKVEGDERLCADFLTSCSITPYGEVNPCVQIKFKKNNDLNNRPFMQIWRDNEEIKRLRGLRMKDKKDCWGCNLINHCLVCPGVALLECGSLLAKLPEACRQAKIRKEIYEEKSNRCL